MTQAMLNKKVISLEAQIKGVMSKLNVLAKRDPDESNWQMIKPTLKRVRRELYLRTYGKAKSIRRQ